jgi:hypothetical protein
MILPLFPAGAFGEPASFVVAVGIGVAFGAVLERAGLGSATKLAGQFYFTDFAVFKVMFTAIVTAMFGVYALSWLGIMDLHQLTVPPTWLLPQLAGGLLFGVGFVMGGLCPGTSCVAAASGRLDGLALIAGMLTGTLLFGELFPWIARFYEATPMGRYTLPQLLHLPEAATVALVAGAALTAFRLLGLWERRHTPT